MSKLNIKKVPSTDDRTLPVFGEIDDLFDRIRERAFERFRVHGIGGRELEDWLEAEREVCWPASELVEEDDEFEVKIALAGFKPGDIELTATPRELIVKAEHDYDEVEEDETVHFSEFRHSTVYRRIPLPSDIDVTKVEAEFEHGLLEIEAPKADSAGGKATKIAVK
jgi:HSP20 family protein